MDNPKQQIDYDQWHFKNFTGDKNSNLFIYLVDLDSGPLAFGPLSKSHFDELIETNIDTKKRQAYLNKLNANILSKADPEKVVLPNGIKYLTYTKMWQVMKSMINISAVRNGNSMAHMVIFYKKINTEDILCASAMSLDDQILSPKEAFDLALKASKSISGW